MVSSIHAAALSGIDARVQSFERAASRIARGGPDENLARDLVETMVARTGVAANVAVLRTADEMVGTLIDVVA
jgi:hypothetical protein